MSLTQGRQCSFNNRKLVKTHCVDSNFGLTHTDVRCINSHLDFTMNHGHVLCTQYISHTFRAHTFLNVSICGSCAQCAVCTMHMSIFCFSKSIIFGIDRKNAPNSQHRDFVIETFICSSVRLPDSDSLL